MKGITCPKCNGSGRIPDPVSIGAEMRLKRIAAGVTLAAVADKMGFTKPYLSDLELGRRSFNEKLIRGFEHALNHTKKKG